LDIKYEFIAHSDAAEATISPWVVMLTTQYSAVQYQEICGELPTVRMSTHFAV